MEVDNGNTVWIAAFFPIEGMDIRHLEVARLVCGKGGVKGRHFACGCLSGPMFCCRNKISKVSGNFNMSNNIRDKRKLYMSALWENLQTPKFFQPTIFLTPQSPGELAQCYLTAPESRFISSLQPC
jgi:hypothetical protein